MSFNQDLELIPSSSFITSMSFDVEPNYKLLWILNKSL